MSDITLPFTLTSGSPAVAEEYNKNLYNPQSPANSFDVVNGQLDNDNREAGWDIDHSHVRSLSMAGGRMTGTTANSDYIAALFPVEAGVSDAYKEMIPITGASISFYCPVQASVAVFTWQLMISNDSRTDSGNTLHPSTMFFIDGVHKRETFRTFPGTMDHGTHAIKNAYRDRLYSGHYTLAPLDSGTLTAGWHTASLRLLMPGDTSILSSSYTTRDPLARVRVRNMKVFWLA
tara:strand:- start:2408 stop:3106 length:699 start_codon:yes stop_codon:yes gene_type:complete